MKNNCLNALDQLIRCQKLLETIAIAVDNRDHFTEGGCIATSLDFLEQELQQCVDLLSDSLGN
jgi:hypothetical protein